MSPLQVAVAVVVVLGWTAAAVGAAGLFGRAVKEADRAAGIDPDATTHPVPPTVDASGRLHPSDEYIAASLAAIERHEAPQPWVAGGIGRRARIVRPAGGDQ